MSTQNQLPTQGSLLEQKAKRKTNLPLVVGIFLGIHAVVLGGILMSGCKREDPPVAKRAPEPPLPPITPPDTTSPVTPAPVPPIGGAPVPGGAGTLAPMAPLPPAGTPVTPAPGAVPPAPAPLTPATAPAPVPPVPTTPIPAPAPVPEPASLAPAGEAKVHVVAKNDSFYTMSKKYGVGMKAIEAANPGVDSTRLKIGQKINIPAAAPKAPSATGGSKSGPAVAESGTYTVKSGDNLGKIAKSLGTSVAKLREANGLKTDQIKVGQKLKLPSGSSSKKSPEPTAPAATTTPLPRTEPVPLTPPALPPLGEPAPAPKPPGQL